MGDILFGKVALVTGAGRGIGAATARNLAKHGARVILTSRTESELDHVLAQIRMESPQSNCERIVADLLEESAVLRLFTQIRSKFGRLNLLVNNAGVARVENFSASSTTSWDEVMGVNLRGAYICSREAFRLFSEGGTGGCIVNISSLGGIKGTEKFLGLTSYTVSKHGMIGLTESLAVEGKALGIRVNCVAPGAVETEMLRKAAPFLKTNTTPQDIARIILFLCDDSQSGSLNGAVIEVHSNL